jgi:methylase of polypeptide subunit release factors
MSRTPYLAAQDSALLRKVLVRYSGEKCLEIGSGNAGNLVELSRRFGLVVGTDLVRPTMEDWKDGHADYLLTDGAACLRPSIFDFVAFNPPYIVADIGDRTIEGGTSLEVPLSFLREALRVVKETGVVLMLLNDQADLEEFRDVCAGYGFSLEPTDSERAFFEQLTVFVASRRPRLHRQQFESVA